MKSGKCLPEFVISSPHNKLRPARINKATLKELGQLPLPQLFSEIYRKQFWGSETGHDYFSGSGSHDPEIVIPYLEALHEFFDSLGFQPVIVDLGCGDFHVGSQLSRHAQHYHACDIVEELIAFLSESYPAGNVEFHCIDATKELLPDGDVLIVRQVLQHLSNDDITKIITQFSSYRYVIVTEHLPSDKFDANKEKPNGPDNRLRWQSGVDLLMPPFDLPAENSIVLSETNDSSISSSVLRTTLYEMLA